MYEFKLFLCPRQQINIIFYKQVRGKDAVFSAFSLVGRGVVLYSYNQLKIGFSRFYETLTRRNQSEMVITMACG